MFSSLPAPVVCAWGSVDPGVTHQTAGMGTPGAPLEENDLSFGTNSLVLGLDSLL